MPAGQAPLFGMTSMMKTETAVQPEHGFFTKTMLFPQLTVTAAGQTAADTTFNVTSTINVLPGMLMRVDSTGENIIVNAVLGSYSSYCSTCCWFYFCSSNWLLTVRCIALVLLTKKLRFVRNLNHQPGSYY
jgi:hypothetical protein